MLQGVAPEDSGATLYAWFWNIKSLISGRSKGSRVASPWKSEHHSCLGLAGAIRIILPWFLLQFDDNSGNKWYKELYAYSRPFPHMNRKMSKRDLGLGLTLEQNWGHFSWSVELWTNPLSEFLLFKIPFLKWQCWETICDPNWRICSLKPFWTPGRWENVSPCHTIHTTLILKVCIVRCNLKTHNLLISNVMG